MLNFYTNTIWEKLIPILFCKLTGDCISLEPNEHPRTIPHRAAKNANVMLLGRVLIARGTIDGATIDNESAPPTKKRIKAIIKNMFVISNKVTKRTVMRFIDLKRSLTQCCPDLPHCRHYRSRADPWRESADAGNVLFGSSIGLKPLDCFTNGTPKPLKCLKLPYLHDSTLQSWS